MKGEEGGTGQDRERHRKETVCVSGSRVGVSEQSFVVGADNKLQQDKCIHRYVRMISL